MGHSQGLFSRVTLRRLSATQVDRSGKRLAKRDLGLVCFMGLNASSR